MNFGRLLCVLSWSYFCTLLVIFLYWESSHSQDKLTHMYLTCKNLLHHQSWCNTLDRLHGWSATRLYLSRCLRRRTINVQSRLWEHSPNIGKRILITRTQSYWPPAKIRESSIWAMGRFCHSPVCPRVTVFQTNAGYGFQQLLPTPLPPHHFCYTLVLQRSNPL